MEPLSRKHFGCCAVRGYIRVIRLFELDGGLVLSDIVRAPIVRSSPLGIKHSLAYPSAKAPEIPFTLRPPIPYSWRRIAQTQRTVVEDDQGGPLRPAIG